MWVRTRPPGSDHELVVNLALAESLETRAVYRGYVLCAVFPGNRAVPLAEGLAAQMEELLVELSRRLLPNARLVRGEQDDTKWFVVGNHED
jgi:hypothetical protein